MWPIFLYLHRLACIGSGLFRRAWMNREDKEMLVMMALLVVGGIGIGAARGTAVAHTALMLRM